MHGADKRSAAQVAASPLTRGRGRPRKDTSSSVSTRELILESAGKLFAANGYASTSVSDIATEAGIQQSSVYYYFDNKEAILRSSSSINRESLSFAVELSQRSDDVHLRLYDLLYYDTLHLCNSPLDFNEVERLAEADPKDFSDFWDDYRKLRDITCGLIAEGVGNGIFRPCDEDLAACAMLSLNEGLQKRYRTQEGHSYGSDNPFVVPPRSPGDYAGLSAITSLRSVVVEQDVLGSLEHRIPVI